MAVDMFLKLDGVNGESGDDKHKKEIEVLSWSWGVSNTSSMAFGSGGGEGKAQFHDLTIGKKVDASSPVLTLFCTNGKHIATGLLTLRKAGGTALEYLKFKMDTLFVTSVTLGGSSDGPTEQVTLTFAKIAMDYTPQKPDGSGDAAISFKWDAKAQKEA